MKDVKPAMMTVGGWFDAEDLFGALRLYSSAEKQSPGANNTIVMGPWSHGGWANGPGDRLGPVTFNSKTGEFYRDNIEFPFFLYHLKGKGDRSCRKLTCSRPAAMSGVSTTNGRPRKLSRGRSTSNPVAN
jgi:predicted acyl esterase